LVDLSREIRAVLASDQPIDEAEARALLSRLADALEQAQDHLADADVAAARAEADELVDEARRARERILRDLARRRHEARREVAQLQAGRDALLEAFALVKGTIDGTTRELNLALAEARLRAGNAGRAIDRQDLPTAADLDAELEMARLAGLPLVAPDPPASAEPEPEPEPEPEVETEAEAVPPPRAKKRKKAAPRPASPRTPQPSEEPGEPALTAAERTEKRAAQRLKRALADEQNDVLDRLRQREKRKALTVDLLLGGDLQRIARYRDALVPVLVEAGDDAARADTVASDAAEAIVRGTRSRIEALVAEATDGRTVDEDRVTDGVRACFREWKTQWLVRLAADSVAMSSSAAPGDP
jgi:hypothetical protein